jgi:2-polyprenyl-3-methyl-5-hydroxy-6-metoxy-1,4-benzoquinol methylase
MSLNSGERQVSPTIEGIRHDHVARYAWAAQEKLAPGARVIDIACGVGYGTRILAECGHVVFGGDNCVESIQYAKIHHANPNAAYGLVDAEKVKTFKGFDAAVCFETVEHIRDPRPLLKALAKCKMLLASVPNEDDFPFAGHKFHFRHYRSHEFEALLNECGWKVKEWFRQEGPFSDVTPGKRGRTLIAVCSR